MNGIAMMSQQLVRRIVILGPPGVGKGTYAGRLAPFLGLKHVIVGDLVRSEINECSKLGNEIAAVVTQGKLVADDIILQLVMKHLKGLEGFILDGMPRTLQQAISLDAIMPIDLALRLHLDEDIMLEKACARRIGPNGRVYNLAYVKRGMWNMPPHLPEKTRCDAEGRLFCAHGVEIRPNQNVQCISCTKALHTREDDREDVWHRRLQAYKAQTCPVIDYYAAKNIIVDFPITGDVEVCLPQALALVQERSKDICSADNLATTHAFSRM